MTTRTRLLLSGLVLAGLIFYLWSNLPLMRGDNDPWRQMTRQTIDNIREKN